MLVINKRKKLLTIGLAFLICMIIIASLPGKDFIVNLFTKLEIDELTMDFSKTRLLVLAPHNDDETLGCGNLITKVVRAGGKAKVVLLTNGDGHASAVAVRYLTIKPKAKDYIRSAYARQRETENAMIKTGITKNNIIYLGYPDGGLYNMWKENWDENNLFSSYFTKESCTPYTNSYTINAPYCGKKLSEDLEKIIREYNPTIIAFPHPNDKHPDHFSTYCFAKYILEKNKLTPKQYLYLVHRGNWPSPRGQFSKLFLVPPRELIDLGTHWASLSMDETEVAEKAYMIREYKSQNNVMGPFLKSFIRQNELFGIYPDLEYQLNNKDNSKILILEDPSNYKLRKSSSKSGDIREVYLASDGANMILSLNAVRIPNSRISYHFDIHFFSGDGKTFRVNMVINGGKSIDLLGDTSENITSISGLKLVDDTDMLNISIPYSAIPDFDSFLISASTSSNYKIIDRTAWRLTRKNFSIP
jgi:LmbE family N-acetylglucosaminyl deacetylase